MKNNAYTDQEIQERAKDLASKLYEENKDVIEDTLADNEDEVNKQGKQKKKKHFILKFFGISAIILILILIVSNVLDTGKEIIEKTNKTWLGYGFYGLVCLLLIILIIIPSFEIFCLPSYNSLFEYEEKGKKGKVIANVKKILLLNKKHSSEWLAKAKEKEIERYNEAIKILKESNDSKELQKNYHYIYKKYIKPDVLKIVTNNSNKIFISTAITQDGKVDSLIMFFSYFKMAKEILKYCGFRISFVRLCKLMINVLVTLYAATKLNDFDYTAIFPDSMMESLKKIPGASVIVNSLSDGVANSLMFYKTGVILEELLLSDNQNQIYQLGVSIKETAKYMLIGLLVEILKKVVQFTKYVVKSTVDAITSFFQTLIEQIGGKKKLLTKE